MYVHYLKLLQDHYYIITLSYCHGTAYYYLMITTKRLFLALALVTAAVPGTGQALTGRMSSRYKHRTGISNPCGHLCQWTWTTVTGLLVTRADSAAEKWPWQQCQCCCTGQKFCLPVTWRLTQTWNFKDRIQSQQNWQRPAFQVSFHWLFRYTGIMTQKHHLLTRTDCHMKSYPPGITLNIH